MVLRRLRFFLAGMGMLATIVQGQSSGDNCTFRRDPEGFLRKQERANREGNARTLAAAKNGGRAAAVVATVNAADLPTRNLIDEEILGRLTKDGIQAAPISSDTEFVRRIYLDLIGRLPKPDEFREFVANSEPR